MPRDLGTVVARKNDLVSGLRQTKYADVATAHGIDVLSGEARFLDDRTLAVGDLTLDINSVVIATGAATGPDGDDLGVTHGVVLPDRSRPGAVPRHAGPVPPRFFSR